MRTINLWIPSLRRYLGNLKGTVNNKMRPEESIAVTYIVNECLTFYSLYFQETETTFNKQDRYGDGDHPEMPNTLAVFTKAIRLFRAPVFDALQPHEIKQLHWYILSNCEELANLLM